MAIIKTVQHSGANSTSTLSGNIELNEAMGEILIRNGSHILTRIDSEGFTYAETDGTRRIRIGLNPADSSVGEFISKPTIDVIEALTNGS